MNAFFGVASRRETLDLTAVGERVTGYFGHESTVVASVDGRSIIGWVSNDGAVLGSATTDTHALVYVGAFQYPLPDWTQGSPPEDPNRTASFLLSRFLAHDAHFLDGVDGQYAIAVLDRTTGQLSIAIDPNGYRQIFARRSNEGCSFSSNLSSMNYLQRASIEIDRSLEDFLLGYEFLPWGRTMYCGVHRLPKGTVQQMRDDNIIESKIGVFDAVGEPVSDVSEDAVSTALYDALMETVTRQCPPDLRIAVLLGGFDSALVAAALVRLGKEVHTFTFGFEDKTYNQSHTDTLSAHLGTVHHWVHITAENIGAGMRCYEQWFNQPASQPHYLIQTAIALNQMRQEGFLHCFSGDGCDELFLGYPMVHKRAQFFMKIGVMPRSIAGALNTLLAIPFLERHLGHPLRVLRNIIDVSARRMPSRGHIANRIFDKHSLEQLRPSQPPLQEFEPEEVLQMLVEGLEECSPIRLAYLGKGAVGINRNRNEGASSGSGVTIRSPFQDSRFRAIATQLPEALLRPDDPGKVSKLGKYILMKMASDRKLLPPEIIEQQKASPVTSPVDHWFMGSLRSDMINTIERLPFTASTRYVGALLKWKLAEEIFRRYFTIGRFCMHAISLLATYASFTRHGKQ